MAKNLKETSRLTVHQKNIRFQWVKRCEQACQIVTVDVTFLQLESNWHL